MKQKTIGALVYLAFIAGIITALAIFVAARLGAFEPYVRFMN